MIYLIRLFLVEEIRLRREFSSSISLLLMPQLILMASLFGYLFAPIMEDTIRYEDLHMAAVGGLFAFGITMGGLAFLGKDFIERSLGPVSMLASSSDIQPMGSRKVYLAYFIHDLIFLIFLILIPSSLGFLIGNIASPMDAGRVFLIISAHWSSFILGLSISVLLASILTNRKKIMLLLIPLSLLPLFLIQYLSGDIRSFVVPYLAIMRDQWSMIGLSLLLSSLFISIGVSTFGGMVRTGRSRYAGGYRRISHLFSRFNLSTYKRSLLVRDLLNIIRGGAYIRIGFSLLMPVIIMGALAGIISGIDDAPVEFNMVFFSVMISFFTVSVYTNLTNLDYLDCDQNLPISTAGLIRMKVILHVLISIPFSLAILIVIAFLTNDWSSLSLGIPFMFIAIPYMGFVTAYLTGLWTNSLLFNSGVFLKYILFTVLPLVMATFLSYLMDSHFWIALAGLGAVMLTGIVAMKIINRWISEKWGNVPLFSGRMNT